MLLSKFVERGGVTTGDDPGRILRQGSLRIVGITAEQQRTKKKALIIVREVFLLHALQSARTLCTW